MYIKKLKLSDYRNIESAEIELGEGLNVFFGENAQGKTNAVEAMFLLSAGKSFKKSTASDLIRFNTAKAEASALFFDGKNDCLVRAELLKNERKKIYLDEMPCEKASEYVGRIGTVLFTPDHLSLVNAEPEYRRKFLDLALCQSKPTLIAVYKSYARLLAEKGTIIKNARENGGRIDEFLIDVYNEKLSVCCEMIANARINLCKKISLYGEAIYKEMTGGRENISFEYSKSVEGEEDLKNKYYELLKKGFETEKNTGICYYGVHRDDVKIKINSKSAKEFASQGQKRSAVLAMKLAEGDYLCEAKGTMPIFLFDDILSELDENRRDYIMSRLKNRQVILTSCNEEFLREVKEVKYMVENGRFTRI